MLECRIMDLETTSCARARKTVNLLALALAVAGATLAVSTSLLAADADKPHPHRGILPGYDDMPEIVLDEAQLATLAKGDLVTMTIEGADGNGRGVAVIDIAALPDVVWSRIRSFEHYPEWVGPVKECEVLADRGDTVWTRIKISGLLYSYEYFLVNTFRIDENFMTWSLDYDRYSDLDDCVGGWFVEPHPAKDDWSRAWFSSDLKLRSPLPGFAMNEARSQALKDATAWVKRESEKAAGIESR